MTTPDIKRQPPEVLEDLRHTCTATVVGALIARGFMRQSMIGVRCLTQGALTIGHAVTVRYVPVREDILAAQRGDTSTNPMWIVLDRLEETDVIVAGTGGDDKGGLVGDVLVTRIKVRGAQGFVTDGTLRDYPLVKDFGIGLYAGYVNANPSVVSVMALDRNIPLACGGALVFPGDVVIGDDDGVVVIPAHLAAEVAGEAREKEGLEAWIRMALEEEKCDVTKHYPPTEAARQGYAEWLKKQGK